MARLDHRFTLLAALAGACALAACGPSDPASDPDVGVDPVLDGGPGDGGPTDGGADAGIDGGDDAGTDGGAPVVLKIRTVTPPRGGLNGGIVVVVAGAGFVDGFADFGGRVASDQTTISFGGNPALDVNVIDDDTIEVRAPSGARGPADVTLANPNGSVTCVKCFTYFEAVELSRVTPTSGSTRGGESFTLTGKGFQEGILVLVGGSEATDVVISADGTSLTAKTPPGSPGSADVGVIAPNSSAFLRRGYVYLAPTRVLAVTPAASSTDGGVSVEITGQGFTADAAVTFGGVAATSVAFVSDTKLTAKVPAGGAGAVDVTVTGRRGSATLRNGFAYFDASSRELSLVGVSPRHGPAAGGTCAQGPDTCLTLSGSGFTQGDLTVKIGGTDATFRVVDDNTLSVDLPPGTPGLADVQLRGDRGSAILAQAFGYVVPLTLTGLAPAFAPATGTPAVTATLKGSGFAMGCTVTIGSGEAAIVSVSGDATSAAVSVPPGAPGERDVRVQCGDPDSVLYQEVVLAKGFQYTTPLELLQVDPETGAIAGGTSVTLYGAGFLPGMEVLFGRTRATNLEVKSSHVATVRTPRADVGVVDVSIRSGTQNAVLAGAFSYLDPTNILGGASGGPMRGTLNVTVLNSTQGMEGPVDGVTISINADELVGTTDARGQVTFSDPALLKPVTITGKKPKFAAATIARVDARNVTLYMEMNEGDGEPSEPPPPPPPATLTGRVCGFKLPTGFVLGRGQSVEARVFMTAPYVYAAPPFGQPARPVRVTQDCGTYTVVTRRYGALALYAQFGIVDANTAPATFTPLLMGIRRGLEAAPDKTVAGLDIVLDMHLDVRVPITVEPAAAPPGKSIINLVYSYLDLGGEGVVPLAETQSSSNSFIFERHPRVGGEGLMFLNLAAIEDIFTGDINPPYSFYYRRQYGELGAGVEIGPMLAFTTLTTPLTGGTFTGSLGWGYTAGQKPDVTQIFVEEPQGFATKPIWNVILPGTEQGVSLPPSTFATMPAGTELYWTVMTARSPRFDYDRFGYQQLGVTAWTSFTQDFSSFTVP